jgi:hypothetical protein
VDVAHERFAAFRLAEHALELGLEDVDVERQVVALESAETAAK